MVIRRYGADDRDAVRQIHAEAFRRPASAALPGEVAVLDALIEDGDMIDELSFVAVDAGEPIGHVICSRATVGRHPVSALGPIGVLPAHQRAGVGSALVHEALAAADAAGEPLMALLGSPGYYRRFGFVTASDLEIDAPDPAWQAHFQVRTLAAYRPEITGGFEYARAFSLV